MTDATSRVENELRHGRQLAAANPEALWGWDTPAGRVRARRRADMMIARAGMTARTRVLEVGCGTGIFTGMFAETGASILAVELSPDLVAIAAKKGLPADRVRFAAQRFEDVAEEGTFDAIIGSSVLHHLELDPALARMFALLKPGGSIVFAEPNYLNPQVFLERALRFLPCFRYVSPDETAFVRGGLRRRLVRHGFADVRIEPFDWLHPAVPRRLIGAVSRLGGWLERTPCIREFSGSLLIKAGRPL